MRKHLKPFISRISKPVRVIVWFLLGALLGLFFFISFLFIFYRHTYQDDVFPGVFVNSIDFSGKSKEEVSEYFSKRNENVKDTTILLSYDNKTISTTAKELALGYNATLLSDQAYSIGRSSNVFSNIAIILQAYISGVYLSPAYEYDWEKVETLLAPVMEEVNVDPVDARFTVENGRVTQFRSHQDGKQVDLNKLREKLLAQVPGVLRAENSQRVIIQIPISTLQPEITTNEVNDKGVKELVGTGTSLFKGSIPNRAFNLTLASNRLSGILVKPDEEFSFAKALGDISSFTGYKQAYVISGGRTVLGDGGGVCQVSTTFFRALLNAGLPITERNQHAYRVSYYEQDMGPGFDAAVYVPSVDLKFKNDTGNYLLIQTTVDPVEQRLTFDIYGTKDGREVEVTDPIILSQSPAPEPLYQDDPTLPIGEVKQVDFAAPGARVSFKRTVTKDGKIYIEDTFNSNYRPWQAIFMRGTKEG